MYCRPKETSPINVDQNRRQYKQIRSELGNQATRRDKISPSTSRPKSSPSENWLGEQSQVICCQHTSAYKSTQLPQMLIFLLCLPHILPDTAAEHTVDLSCKFCTSEMNLRVLRCRFMHWICSYTSPRLMRRHGVILTTSSAPSKLLYTFLRQSLQDSQHIRSSGDALFSGLSSSL